MNNRIIKFRAWNKIIEAMYPWEEIENDSSNRLWQVFEGLEESGFILMQSTGLTDKNGKEIFEGDIVKYKFMTGFDCGWDNGESWDKNSNTITEQVKEVVFRNGEFYPKETANLVEDGYYSYRLFDLEVIGNIYTDSHLLAK